MKLEIKTWLYDILNAIKEIEFFIEPSENFSSFQNDLKTKEQLKEILKSSVKQ